VKFQRLLGDVLSMSYIGFEKVLNHNTVLKVIQVFDSTNLKNIGYTGKISKESFLDS